MKALLILTLFFGNAISEPIVQPFPTLAECQAERDKLIGLAGVKFAPGQQFVLDCVRIDTAGVKS